MTKPLFRIEKLWMNRWMVYSIFHGLQRQYAQGAFDMLCGLSGGSESFRLVKYETEGGNLKSLIEIERHHTGEVNTNAKSTDAADAGSEVKK